VFRCYLLACSRFPLRPSVLSWDLTAPSDALPGNELRVTLRLNLSIVPAYSQLKLGGGNFSTGFLPRNVAYYAGYDTDHYGAVLSDAAMFRIASGYGLFSTANVFR
jgi:hypothetical protein